MNGRAQRPERGVLALNAGSSSVKFALYPVHGDKPVLSGRVGRAGSAEATLSLDRAGGPHTERHLGRTDQQALLRRVFDACDETLGSGGVVAVGHRIVHGGAVFSEPVRIDAAVLAELRRMCPYDPLHQAPEIDFVEAVGRWWPDLPQIACFDTAFHADLPPRARLLPLPRGYAEDGLRRYGFHGLSYTFLLGELRRLGGADGRVILAHLGSGSSLAAVHDGRAIDTTMGFTPNSGLIMSTRSGELDPGVLVWLARNKGMSLDQIFTLASRGSGLLGISGTSGDLRDLLAREAEDPRAAEAVESYCYVVRKAIGAYAAALGGLDTLVFSGGIGEHAGSIRARICSGLEFLGIELEAGRNAVHAPEISAARSRVTVRVIPTNEESVIAQATQRLIQIQNAA
jgi:acetate kinase